MRSERRAWLGSKGRLSTQHMAPGGGRAAFQRARHHPLASASTYMMDDSIFQQDFLLCTQNNTSIPRCFYGCAREQERTNRSSEVNSR